jgi:hypothetical protein
MKVSGTILTTFQSKFNVNYFGLHFQLFRNIWDRLEEMGFVSSTFSKYVDIDNEIPVAGLMTEDEIVANVKGEDSDTSDDIEISEDPHVPTTKEAREACQTLRVYLQSLPENSNCYHHYVT